MMKSISRFNLTVYVVAFAYLAITVEARPFGGAPLSFSRVDSFNQEQLLFNARGGDATLAESDDEAATEIGDEEETSKSTSTLASSAIKASDKSRKTKADKAKTAVSEELSQKKSAVSKKKKKSSRLRLPYILRACMNPFTVLAMTKAYFASLFSVDYIKKVWINLRIAGFLLADKETFFLSRLTASLLVIG